LRGGPRAGNIGLTSAIGSLVATELGGSTMARTRTSADAARAARSWNGSGRLWLAAALALALAAVLARASLFVVGKAEYALVTEFGRPVQVIDRPGLAFKLPYRSVRFFDRRLFVYTPPPGEFLTREKTSVVAAGAILWRIADPTRFFETVFDRAGAESRLGDILSAALGAAIAENPFASFVSLDPAEYRADAVVAEVARRCRDVALRDYGIAVTDVQLQSFDFPKQNRQRVYARMAAERGQISMRYRSEGDEAGLGVRAAAEEEKARIIARATEAAQQHRGEGESEAARIYAAALAADPDFYKFLRTMEAARAIVHRGTTMVLPADSELFGLLYDSNHYSHADASASAQWTGVNPAEEDKATR
jgi:membrane protease subunit HflC